MPRVALADIPAGSELAEPVLDSRGRVLLRAGALLTPTVVACLQRWSVATVSVSEPGSAPETALEPTWKELFSSHHDPETKRIHAALVKWNAARAQGGERVS